MVYDLTQIYKVFYLFIYYIFIYLFNYEIAKPAQNLSMGLSVSRRGDLCDVPPTGISDV